MRNRKRCPAVLVSVLLLCLLLAGSASTGIFAAALQSASSESVRFAEDGSLLAVPGTTVAGILSQCGMQAYVADAEGAVVASEASLASGMRLCTGSTTYAISVLGDIDGDTLVTAADARLCLRASVQLETLNATLLAAARTGKETAVSAATARLVLRASVGLEDPASWFRTIFDIPEPSVEPPAPDPYLLLVNHANTPGEDYPVELAEAVAGSEVYLEKGVAAAYQSMYNAARADGVDLYPASGYRSYALQKRLFEDLLNTYRGYGYSYESSYALAAQEIMPPGYSEHNYGLAMDIGWVDDSFVCSAAYAWLTANAADYGFIERYTAAKQPVTGVIPEVWHWRYVGSAATAHAIKNSGLCLEEWLAANP